MPPPEVIMYRTVPRLGSKASPHVGQGALKSRPWRHGNRDFGLAAEVLLRNMES